MVTAVVMLALTTLSSQVKTSQAKIRAATNEIKLAGIIFNIFID
jgi:hypothetical protein